MAEYIDREAAIEKLCDRCGECLKAKGKDCAVVRIMDKIPAADVQEVKRGRWEQHYDDPWNVHCSNCDYAMPYAVVRPNYCENCGAKTDERSE